MKKDLVFQCRKCQHQLFLSKATEMTGKEIAKKLETDCPNCGEEAEDLWIYSRLGNFEKEYA